MCYVLHMFYGMCEMLCVTCVVLYGMYYVLHMFYGMCEMLYHMCCMVFVDESGTPTRGLPSQL
jgi:hypothetical protein